MCGDRRSVEPQLAGLGLPIAHALAQAHGGSLRLHSPDPGNGKGVGTLAVLRLPRWNEPALATLEALDA